jgi:hypothetical protein
VILPSEEDAGFLGMGELVDKVKGEEFMEALSVLYVGLTRAKRDLEVVVGGPRKRENLNLGEILRSQWGWPEEESEGELEVVDSKAEKFSGPKRRLCRRIPVWRKRWGRLRESQRRGWSWRARRHERGAEKYGWPM